MAVMDDLCSYLHAQIFISSQPKKYFSTDIYNIKDGHSYHVITL